MGQDVGSGYGYVSKKVSKRICRARNTRPVVSEISTMSDSVSHVANSGMKGKVTSDGRLASGDRNATLQLSMKIMRQVNWD